MSVLLAGSLLLFVHSTEAFQIPECLTNGYVDLLEFKETTLTCQGLSQDQNDSIIWLVVQDGKATPIATCSVWACQLLDDKSNFSVTPSSVSNGAQLTIKQSHKEMDGRTIRCSNYTEVWSEPAECKLRVIWTSSSAGTTLQTTSTATQHTTQEQASTTDRTSTVDTDLLETKDGDDVKPLPWAAIGGGVAAAVVVIVVIVIIIIVIFKRRLVSRKRGGNNRNDDVEEHVNVVYEPGGQDNNHTSTAQKQAVINTSIVPAYDDDQLDDDEEIIGYTTVNLNPHARAASSTVNSSGSSMHTVVNRSAPWNVGVTHANSLPAIRQDLDLDETELTDEFDSNYSAVDVPRPITFAAPSGTSSHGDEYAVVDKSAKGKKGPTFQPDVYAEVNKSKPNPAGDVYAEVDKSSKRWNSQGVQHNVDSANGGYYAEVRKPRPGNKPTLAVKPVLKPKPTLQLKNGASPGDDPAEPGDYNILTFGAKAHHAGSEDDADQQYSHI